MTELFNKTAVEAVDLLKSGEINPMDLLEAAIARIEAVDGRINALPIRCFERAYEQVLNLEKSTDRQTRFLYGLPIAVKDYITTCGKSCFSSFCYPSPQRRHII